MPALERLVGWHVVADPATLDRALPTSSAGPSAGGTPVSPSPRVLRIAPDEALVFGSDQPAVDDPDAIIEPETGFVGGWIDLARVTAHLDWALPIARPSLAQGALAGVPSRLWLTADAPDRAFVVVAGAYAAELTDRLR